MKILEYLKSRGLKDDAILTSFSHYSTRSHKVGNSIFFYCYRTKEVVLGVVSISKKGEIFDVRLGEYFLNDNDKREFLDKIVFDVAGLHGKIIFSRILFSHKQVNGFFQYKNIFRIRPFSSFEHLGKGLALQRGSLDKLNETYHLGPPFPFILEVCIERSPNGFIESSRACDSLDFWQWTLCLLIPHLISSPISSGFQRKWVVLNNNGKTEFHLVSEALGLPTLDQGDKFDFDDLEIPHMLIITEGVDYYSRKWFHDEEVVLSDDFEFLLDVIESLSEDEKNKFRRCVYWFYSGRSLISQVDVAIICFTSAIECLVFEETSDVCENCRRPFSDGPTKKFKRFMDDYLSVSSELERIKKEIYDRRSDRVHGRYLSASDEGAWTRAEDYSSFAIENLVRKAILNWLRNTK